VMDGGDRYSCNPALSPAVCEYSSNTSYQHIPQVVGHDIMIVQALYMYRMELFNVLAWYLTVVG